MGRWERVRRWEGEGGRREGGEGEKVKRRWRGREGGEKVERRKGEAGKEGGIT